VRERFPAIEPYEHGWLEVGDGHRVYFEVSGAPDGEPALFVHGGPGGGSYPGARRFFDPRVYRIVLFDQRGCGKNTPLASAPNMDLSANTTPHLVADMERLRVHLGIERWTLLGLSWGTTLALAYAQAHPERVRAMVLGLVSTCSRREVAWITEGVGALFPIEHEAFAAAVPDALRDRPLVDAYAAMLADPDPAVHDAAARAWCAWEDAHVSLSPGHAPSTHWDDPAFRLGFARLVTHYWRHAAFLGEGEPLRDGIGRLEGIPAVLIHGRFDVSSPLETAYRLSRGWNSSRLVVLDEGHGGPALPAAVMDALDDVRARAR
jgi:proline iminopeptidase